VNPHCGKAVDQGALVEAEGGHNSLDTASMAKEGDEKGDYLSGGAQAAGDGAFGCGEGLLAVLAAIASFITTLASITTTSKDFGCVGVCQMAVDLIQMLWTPEHISDTVTNKPSL
jgi:hypothetical protein